jgi:F-type H+-transporting ATPase subunit b
VHTFSVLIDGAHGVARSLVGAAGQAVTEPDEGPSPIVPEVKELLWSLGAFLVLLAAMRLYLVPKVKAGMQQRYGKVRTDLATAEAMRDDAKDEVAQYEAQLAAVRSEAATRVDAARHVLDGERTDRFAEANAAIAERRSAAAAEAEAAKAAARASVEDAAVAVASRLVELSTGRRPDGAAVRGAVEDLTSAGARS